VTNLVRWLTLTAVLAAGCGDGGAPAVVHQPKPEYQWYGWCSLVAPGSFVIPAGTVALDAKCKGGYVTLAASGAPEGFIIDDSRSIEIRCLCVTEPTVIYVRSPTGLPLRVWYRYGRPYQGAPGMVGKRKVKP
jgi:hypothetical protein